MNHNHYRIGKVHISITSPENAKKSIIKALEKGTGGYFCVSNVRTVLYANKHQDYLNVMEKALMCLPDGMPLVWMARLWGLKDVRRTDGPNLFVSLLSNQNNGIKHFLLGDTEDTLSKLIGQFPNAAIAGMYSPPFCSLEYLDIQEVSEKINNSGANVVWIAMRAPKQDFVAAKLCPLINNKVCIGVGAAFRYALGEYKHPNKVVRVLGLTGFFWRKIGAKELLQYLKYTFYILSWGYDIVFSRVFHKNSCYE